MKPGIRGERTRTGGHNPLVTKIPKIREYAQNNGLVGDIFHKGEGGGGIAQSVIV